VYFNGDGVTSNSDTALKTVTITQNAFPSGDYDIDIDTPSLPQDIYIVGSIINEVGSVTIVNLEGSITVTGEIRAATVDIQAVGDFSLNTDDWEHIGPDPREYLTFDDLAAAARLDAILGDGFLSFGSAASVNDGGENLDTKINNDPSRIVSQGQVAITARYLNINGLIQSGVQTVTLHVDGSFSPNPTGTLVSANGTPVTGVSFGAEGGVVDAFFDHAKQAIVVDDLVPQGGRVILAGQIMSTGHGEIRVAYGYANVDIVNTSGYDLVVNRIDTTTNRTGKITIIDTDRLQKNEYSVDASGVVVEKVFHGTLVTDVTGEGEDGFFSRIDYGTGTAIAFNGFYEPQTGLHYLWTEGQE
jgi:hypothetical protein